MDIINDVLVYYLSVVFYTRCLAVPAILSPLLIYKLVRIFAKEHVKKTDNLIIYLVEVFFYIIFSCTLQCMILCYEYRQALRRQRVRNFTKIPYNKFTQFFFFFSVLIFDKKTRLILQYLY